MRSVLQRSEHVLQQLLELNHRFVRISNAPAPTNKAVILGCQVLVLRSRAHLLANCSCVCYRERRERETLLPLRKTKQNAPAAKGEQDGHRTRAFGDRAPLCARSVLQKCFEPMVRFHASKTLCWNKENAAAKAAAERACSATLAAIEPVGQNLHNAPAPTKRSSSDAKCSCSVAQRNYLCHMLLTRSVRHLS